MLIWKVHEFQQFVVVPFYLHATQPFIILGLSIQVCYTEPSLRADRLIISNQIRPIGGPTQSLRSVGQEPHRLSTRANYILSAQLLKNGFYAIVSQAWIARPSLLQRSSGSKLIYRWRSIEDYMQEWIAYYCSQGIANFSHQNAAPAFLSWNRTRIFGLPYRVRVRPLFFFHFFSTGNEYSRQGFIDQLMRSGGV